jgi:hypothetical protein
MAILGPVHVVVDDLKLNITGPFRRTNNEYSILGRADLVMIDPVGTGFSRPVGDTKGEGFWGVAQDIASVSDFIARYITDNGRWQSPKYFKVKVMLGYRPNGTRGTHSQAQQITVNDPLQTPCGAQSRHDPES